VKQYADAEEWFDDPDNAAWADVARALRAIALDAGLDEAVKWGQPCYTDAGRNVAIIGWMKGSCILSLLKGAHVEDPRGRLEQAGASREGRYLAFQSVAQVEDERAYVADLLGQSLAATREGRTVPPLPDDELQVEELEARLDADPALRAAFEALTPGRRRGFLIHFGKAKTPAGRESRIDAERHKILAGRGLFECACGLSQRMPKCDGSHRSLRP
jgi:uncharacterized protein YdeI (YjbR/CyaY-like superfamily)